MAKVLVRVNVAYPASFIEKMTEQAAKRKDKGETSYTFGSDESIGNIVYAILDWKSVILAKEFWESKLAEIDILEWKSVDKPSVTILRERQTD